MTDEAPKLDPKEVAWQFHVLLWTMEEPVSPFVLACFIAPSFLKSAPLVPQVRAVLEDLCDRGLAVRREDALGSVYWTDLTPAEIEACQDRISREEN